ncbi:MAG TPA: DUF58 domain-containing protein [Candidatus Limnocylindrales bacterium]|jgi:uncharacterized protein (DUF58 family)|nr:DUF58 domain-containing protein [Candidatus Limnocylindrales bacterium]
MSEEPSRGPAAGAGQRDLLPSAVDPTVFDEAFLRQLERLTLLTRKAVHGGMKGVRRSVKRGQSIEFTDYRDYALGDDLRALDWNLYARLERLFIKLFIEEEDVTVHILLDASASMDGGAPDKLLFGKRAAAALAYVGLASYDRVNMAVLQGRAARRFAPVRGTGRVFQVLADLSAVKPAPGPTDLLSAARHYAAQLTQRGPLILISDLFDDNAERAISELAGTRCDVAVLHTLATDELDPPLEGDLRLIDRETAATVDVTADLFTLDAYRERLAEWQARLEQASTKRRVAYVPMPTTTPLSDLVFAELRRRRVVAA